MRRTGRKLSTSLLLPGLLVLVTVVSGARPCRALDVFTLWRQPEIPLKMDAGAWVDFRSQVMAGGRRQESLTRVVCLSRTDDGSWWIEMVPLEEDEAGALHPVAGEGARLLLSGDLESREGRMLDLVKEAIQWRDGIPTRLSTDELLDDPLVSASLSGEFDPQTISREDPTTRVISGVQILCDQLLMSSVDSTGVDLPAGRMIQVSTREITAAVSDELPFLGVAYAAERIRSESRLDPPSSRMSPPPPQIRVEVMELVGFGTGGQGVLAWGD